MENIYASLGPFYVPDLTVKQFELNGIWLEKKLLTADKLTCRIIPGTLVKIEGGKLVNCDGEPTHRIIKCLGTIYSTLLEIEVTDLITGAESSVKL